VDAGKLILGYGRQWRNRMRNLDRVSYDLKPLKTEFLDFPHTGFYEIGKSLMDSISDLRNSMSMKREIPSFVSVFLRGEARFIVYKSMTGLGNEEWGVIGFANKVFADRTEDY
jgi:hypothetical protein